MQTYSVTMGRPGGGSASFKVIVFALSPGMARATAQAQYPSFSAHAVRAHKLK